MEVNHPRCKKWIGEDGSTDDKKWHALLNPILSETNGDLSEVVNSAADTLFLAEDVDPYNIDDDVLIDDLVDDDTGPTEPKQRKDGKTQKGKFNVKPPHKKIPIVRSQTHGLALLANGVKSFVEQPSSRFHKGVEMNKKRDEQSFKFKTEQRELDRQHEMIMIKMLLQYLWENLTATSMGECTSIYRIIYTGIQQHIFNSSSCIPTANPYPTNPMLALSVPETHPDYQVVRAEIL